MGDPISIAGGIVNLGKTAWDIVKDGKATSGAQTSFCSAVPANIPFNELSGWKNQSKEWEWNISGGFGNDLVEATLKYNFQYAGITDKVKNAVFVTNFSVWCVKIEVAFLAGANINATVKGDPYNAGSKDKPIAAIPLLVTAAFNGSNALSRTWLLTAHGDGSLSVG